jgi:hypothetical protein
MVLFWIPLLRLRWFGRARCIVWVMASFLFYLIAHSLLHWYGWKWEPRMIYDISFLFFLLTTAGIAVLLEGARSKRWLYRGAVVSLLCLFGWVLFRDAPRRFAGEYQSYGYVPTYVREQMNAGAVSNSIVFFSSPTSYAPYSSLNSVDFAGDPLLAISQGDPDDFRLISKFPNRSVYYSDSGERLKERANFYGHDMGEMQRRFASEPAGSVAIVVPWADVVSRASFGSLADRVMSIRDFQALLFSKGSDRTSLRTIVLVDKATELLPSAAQLFPSLPEKMQAMDTSVVVLTLTGPKRELPRLPGALITCYAGTEFSGAPIYRGVVNRVSAEECRGQNVSIVWEALFDLPRDRELELELSSDDGSEIFIDGASVVSTPFKVGVFPPVRGKVFLSAGTHRLRIRYFNGPAGGFLKAQAVNNKGLLLSGYGIADGASLYVTREMVGW